MNCNAKCSSTRPFTSLLAGRSPAQFTIFHTTEFTMKAIVEIRAAEGGTDAKLLCKDQSSMILAYASLRRL